MLNGNGPTIEEVEVEPEPDATMGLVAKRTRLAVSFRADETDAWGAEVIDERDNYPLIYRDPRQSDSIAKRLNTFRKNRELCDVVLFVNEREIWAHKAVLAAVSPALFDMFKGDVGSDEQNEVTPRAAGFVPSMPATGPSYFEFPQGDFDCFDSLVTYAYTSCLEIRSKKVAELYKTACALRVQACAKACAAYLAQTLSVGNCIGIRKCANYTNDVLLASTVDTFLKEHVAEVVENSLEFTQLPCIKVRVIIRSDQIAKEAGTVLAEKALIWLQTQHHFDRLEHHIENLVDKTHLLYMDDDQSLQDCHDMDERSSVGSCDLVQDYKRSGSARRSISTTGSLGVVASQHHVTGATSVRINASRTGNRYSSCESLNSLSSTSSENTEEVEWKLIAVTQTSDQYWVAVAILHRRLIALSIRVSDNEDLKTLHHIDATTERQILDRAVLLADLVNGTVSKVPLPTMNQARCSVGAACLADKVVVCGGYDRGECLRTVEQYDAVTDVWSFLPSMLSERGRFDAVVAGGKLFAVAGSNGTNDLSTVECYDPHTAKWTHVAPLKLARSHNGCASVNDIVYCVGGCNEQNVLRQCERYLPDKDVWEPIASLNIGRYQAGCTSWRDMIVACGGCDRWSCTDSVELYDPRTNAWRQISSLKSPRRGCSVAVVNDQLYVIGGSDGVQSLATVEILDLVTASWRSGPELTTARANVHAVVTADNVVYAVGGFNGKQFLSSMEILEPGATEWRNWRPKMDQYGISEDPVGETMEGGDEGLGLDNLSIGNSSD
uniref:BTB domain-containing protein n=1 Tax=Plectus sambesii TaxID=2011161 RepID=A0A914VYK5_9BILA